jgi:hypothetical protein
VELTRLEADILSWIADQVDGKPLARQLADVRVTDRLVTPTGFFTTLVSDCQELAVAADGACGWWIDGPFISAPGLGCGAITMLYIVAGRVHELEVVALSGGHPDAAEAWELSSLPVGIKQAAPGTSADGGGTTASPDE